MEDEDTGAKTAFLRSQPEALQLVVVRATDAVEGAEFRNGKGGAIGLVHGVLPGRRT